RAGPATARQLPAGVPARFSQSRVRRQRDRSARSFGRIGGRRAGSAGSFNQRRACLGSAVPAIVSGGDRMHPAVVLVPAAPSITTALLYQPLDFVVVRAPLLSVEAYLDLGDEERQVALLSDPHVRRAIAVGSPSLAGAMERFKQAGLTRRDADRMRAKLLRYQIRMSTRPTPFGLFAGVALSDWGAVTDLTVRSSCMQTRTRPDMAQLMAMVMAAEANPAIRRRLSLFTNPLAVIEAGRVELAERAPTGTGGQRPPVS